VETIDLDKILSKFDQEKVEQISRLMDNLHSLNDALSRLDELNRSGTLDVVISSMYALKTLKDMLNDDALHDLADKISVAVDFVARGHEFLDYINSPIFQVLGKVVTSEELRKSIQEPSPIGLGKLISSLRDPEVQRGLGVVLALLKGIGKNVGGKESGQTP